MTDRTRAEGIFILEPVRPGEVIPLPLYDAKGQNQFPEFYDGPHGERLCRVFVYPKDQAQGDIRSGNLRRGVEVHGYFLKRVAE